MAAISSDARSEERKRRDEAIAAEPPLPPLEQPASTQPVPVEDHLQTGLPKPQPNGD
jgi:hypothetical protein